MATAINTYQCPACTGPLHFAAGSGKLECEYCGSSYEVAEVEAFYAKKAEAAAPKLICPACKTELSNADMSGEATCPGCGAEFQMEDLRAYAAQKAEKAEDNMNWDTAAGGSWQEGETDGLRLYSCKQCGGEIMADETTGATHCPYCGNPVVLAGHFSGALKPDLVIPFKVDKKAAVEALQNHYKGKRLLPKVFKDQNHIEEVKGLYVPVWLFDADADASVEYEATKIHRWSDSEYNYTETRHYAIIRSGGIGFENVPVDGSSKMDDTLMESIEPFDISGAVPFQAAYLPGYLADKYDVDAEASIDRANERIKKSTEDAFWNTVQGYDTVMPVESSINLRGGRARYALYPVWILNTNWMGRKFTFAVNGQTGKTAGDLPMDKGAFWKWMIGVSAAVTAAAFAISYGIWL
jgi:DNA-directed RNA polymerase subunit RPC12/RpoP